MRFFSCFSGIEAASVAWEPLGWQAVGFSEIDPFACSVLAHRYPTVTNYGDIARHAEWESMGLREPVDLLVGGSPCQSFSVAGLRNGLADPRGALALTYLGVADRLRPRWIVWENVLGVLSADGGRAMGSFLGALGELGYGFAYRVLDAQFFGVPQRRKRVFVVARHLGDWRSSAKVLLEPKGLRRDTQPSKQQAAGSSHGALQCIDARERSTIVYAIAGNVIGRMHWNGGNGAGWSDGTMYTLTRMDRHAVQVGMQVRKITPREAERVQGFPDDHTLVPHRGKPASDSLRYKAIGNSMAVPCMAWIGRRIAEAEARLSA